MKHEIENYLPSRSRNAISSLWFNFDCKQSNPDVFKDLPDRLKIGISLSTSSWRKIRGVWSSGGKEKHPEFPPSPSRWSNMAGFEHPNNWFFREMVSICVLKPYDSQTSATYKGTDPFQALARISQIPKRHVWTRNRSPFQLQIDLAPKSRYWPPWMSRLRFFCLFHRLYQENKACAKFHDSTTSFDCISWDSIWWVRSG